MRADYWEKIHLILFLLYTKYQYLHLLFYLNRQSYGTDIKIRKDNVIKIGMLWTFFSYSWLVIDSSIRGRIYLLNLLSTIPYFQNTYNIFCKNTFFCILPANNIFLLSLEENEYAGIKYPINMKYPEKLLLMRILTQRVDIHIE